MTTRLRRWLRTGSFVAAAFFSLLIVGLITTQTAWFKDWLRRYVITQTEQYLNGHLAIRRLDGNLFTGVEIQDVALTQGSETILAARQVGLRYSLLHLIFRGVTIDEIRIDEPRVALRRTAAGWNVAGLVKEQRQEADREGPARPFHGEAQRPELELSSAPPLDEADILSLIIFNRPINDLGEGEKTTLAQRAGSLVGGFVAAPVAQALRDALDVDLLEITPVTDEGGASVSVGNQIGEKVFVKVRQQFGSSETTQLVLEYELSRFLRLDTSVAQGGDTNRTVGRRTERGGADLVFVIKY